MSRASDYQIDYSSGLFTCCQSHIDEYTGPVYLGLALACDECDQEMILSATKSGPWMWRKKFTP